MGLPAAAQNLGTTKRAAFSPGKTKQEQTDGRSSQVYRSDTLSICRLQLDGS